MNFVYYTEQRDSFRDILRAFAYFNFNFLVFVVDLDFVLVIDTSLCSRWKFVYCNTIRKFSKFSFLFTLLRQFYVSFLYVAFLQLLT